MSEVLAWHFVGATLRDGRSVPPDGERLTHTGDLIICERGLHASERIIDALQYAQDGIICRVRCGGKINRDTDKLVCSERTILWRMDATELLREFARRCALDVVHLWNAPEIVLDYLRTGDETKRDAAWAAARGASAWAAARSAAWEAARDAAWAAAAWNAAREAARDAAWAAAARSAAKDEAKDEAWDAARDAQNERLTKMVERAHAEP